jgi:A/G-specific adenine glycosylase
MNYFLNYFSERQVKYLSTTNIKKKFKHTTSEDIVAFRKHVYSWYKQNNRSHLPWRTDYNPYDIFISEVMLQQTQVDRVIDKFIEFRKLFPDFKTLAESELPQLLATWQGLGYNRRALSLRNAARTIVEQHNGTLPDQLDQLETLPGIGPATAASITAFAFNKPVVFLETNIRTVIIYHFCKSEQAVPDSLLSEIAVCILDKKSPRQWYSALMDYGTMLKKTVGNLSRKSATYKKQSTFKGSRRELRGKVLKQLLETPKLSSVKLSEYLSEPSEKLLPVLEQLTRENIVKYNKGRYLIEK